MSVAIENAAEWPLLRLKDVTVDVPSRDPSQKPNTEITYVDISSIDNRICEIVDPKRLLGRDAPSRARRPIEDGDVLFSNVRTYLRNVAQVMDLEPPAIASTGFTLLRPVSGKLTSRYLYHLVRSDFFIAQVSPQQTGSQYPATSDRAVRDNLVPVPPLYVQEALARLLDELERQRRSVSLHLSSARLLVERFRQAILVSACSGVLTADWREDRGTTVDDGVVSAARRRRVDELGKRFREPEPNAHRLHADVPDKWRLVPLGLLLERLDYGTSQRSAYGVDGVPVIRIPNVSTGRLDLSDMKYAALPAKEREDLSLGQSDLLMVRSNGSVELLGRTARVTPDAVGMTFAGYLLRLRPDTSVLLPEYLSLVIATPLVRAQIELPARSTSGVHNINTDEVRGLLIPLPGLDEQREIARAAEALFALTEQSLRRIDAASSYCERSIQALLAKAFPAKLGEVRVSDQAEVSA